ncbi:hypothetical protein WR25_26347 [Diploscapter pachys]|uniref:Nematode cuticle collagen N-terminal domain-containing protein n=1 Tax=Diploscapter pachys TaxID=2018661 RepID=A0A2A2JJH5_9BILA|nr:hypothetical protein WR25_26347 [Diploscapter pachys]
MEKPDGRMKSYKFVAYTAVAFSVVAVLSVVLTLPMVYQYVSHVRRQMEHELQFCKGSAKDIYAEVNYMKAANAPRNRTARQAYGSPEPAQQQAYGGPEVNPAPNLQCDGCCLPGPPGPQGPPGHPADLESMPHLVALAHEEHLENPEMSDHQDPLAHLEHQVWMDPLDDGPPGTDGAPGPIGAPGPAGPSGEKGICPKYCAIDGGVFFEDGTRR